VVKREGFAHAAEAEAAAAAARVNAPKPAPFSTEPPANPKQPFRRRKDPLAPKRAINAYMFFCKDERAKLKARNPGLSFGQVRIIYLLFFNFFF
jgi:hypothetical protein